MVYFIQTINGNLKKFCVLKKSHKIIVFKFKRKLSKKVELKREKGFSVKKIKKKKM